MNINNHRNVASRSKWKENNLLYGKLKKEENEKELIEEVFIIPSKQEYPHHVIRGNTLVLSVDGVKRVYNQLKEKGLYHGKAKQHIDRHLKELGIKMNTSRKMEENFLFIEKSIQKFQLLEIDNSKESAVQGKWKNPGASFYNQLLNAGWVPEGNSPDIDECIFAHQYLEEAYLIAPIKKIKYGPYGTTPFSRSGCKYPHHTIKGNKLVVHIDGLKAAYIRAKQMGEFKGEVKAHLEKHYKELGLYEDSTMMVESTNMAGGEIRVPTSKDYLNPEFVKWLLFKTEEFEDDEPETFDFSIFETDPTIKNYVYGYFIDDIMRGIIRIKYHREIKAYNVDMLFVDPSFHRKHIGATLLQYAIDKFGKYDMMLYVFSDNTPAINLYKKYGFIIDRTIDCPSEKFENRKQHIMIRKSETWLDHFFESEETTLHSTTEEESSENEESAPPKKEDKNGVKRKNLYIAFIEYCKKLNPKNTFSSLFDKDIFKERYSFIPHEMRYFYRLANPMSCIIPVIQFESVAFFEDIGIQQALDQIKKNNKSEDNDNANSNESDDMDDTIEDDSGENEMMIFFSINDLPKINEKNNTDEYVIFAGSPKEYYVFRNKDKKIYKSNDDKITEPIADSFDLFIQKIVGKEYL